MKLAIICVRGLINLSQKDKDTLKFLGIKARNNCVIVEDAPSIKGMLNKIQYFVTWGPVNEEVIALLEKRGKKNKTFHLNSPKKGYGRKGIKIAFKLGGALGYRDIKINDLIKRMI